MVLRISTIIVALLLATLPTLVLASEAENLPVSATEQSAETITPLADDTTTDIPTLGQVTVVGKAEEVLTVSNSLDRGTLNKLPKRDGSINEAISILPGVQLSEEHRTSDNAGEILPPGLSISGGRFYENNFTIDGIDNNSLLDPANANTDSVNDTPGHPQGVFLHPSLVENITVYRANIPARYSSFTGGVVEVETRDPGEVFSGTANFRHTRSEWTSIHRDRERKEEYQNPYDGSVQPKFRKYDGSVSFDLPVNEHMGFLLGYSQVHSKIPLLLIDQTENQYRTAENYFIKFVAHPTLDTKWSLTGNYSPYEAEYFRDEVVDSRYSLDNDAISLVSNLEHRIGRADIEFDLGYSKSTNNRDAPNGFFSWRVSPSKPWGAIADFGKTSQFSKEGGFGDLDKEQESYTSKLHVTIDPTPAAGIVHNLNFGASYEEVEGSLEREKDLTYHTLSRVNANVVCDAGSVDCITGEQFMYFKTIYPEDDIDKKVRFYDAYLENLMTFGQLTVRPGVHVSHDDLQDNTNWAHRLAVGFDLFDDGQTMLFAGHNRYYGKTLLSHALNEKKSESQRWIRSPALNPDGSPRPWIYIPPTTIPATRLADLNTPYTDEITIGFDQQLFGGTLNVTYLDREGEDELAATVLDTDPFTGYRYSEWTDDGNTSHEEVSASWERQWTNHYLLFTATWQETETSNSDYFVRADYPDGNDDGSADPVWFRGNIVDRDNLPRPDFNREYKGTLTYVGRLPYGFTFTNVTSYRSGYDALVNTGENIDIEPGITLDIYEQKKQPESWIFDWKLDWEKQVYRDQAIIVSLEVNNLFNARVNSGVNDDVYELGRQFWLGMTYNF